MYCAEVDSRLSVSLHNNLYNTRREYLELRDGYKHIYTSLLLERVVVRGCAMLSQEIY